MLMGRKPSVSCALANMGYGPSVVKLLSLALLSLCTSCSIVGSKQAVGSKPVDAEKVGLAGTWVNEDGEKSSFVLKDPLKGTLIILSEDDEQEVELRQTGGVLFANLRDEDAGHYLWAELKVSKNKLRIRTPDFDKWAQLVADKKLPAKVIHEEVLTEGGKIMRSSKVLIDDSTGRWVEQLVAGKLGDPYDEDVQSLKRVR